MTRPAPSALSEMMPERDYAEYFDFGYKVISRATRERGFDRNVALGKMMLVEHLSVRKAAQMVGVSKCTASRLLQRLSPRELGRIVPCARCSKDVRCVRRNTFKPRRYCDDCRVIVRRASFRRHKQKNKAQIRVARQAYYQRNRAKLIAYTVQWGRLNPEKKLAKDRRYQQRRKARLRDHCSDSNAPAA